MRFTRALPSIAAATLMIGAGTAKLHATEWQALVGAESSDLGSQALAYLPNELWIHAGDSIRWNLNSTEVHTLTFLTPGQTRPPNFGPVFGVTVGCPGNTPDGASFDGSSCVNSGYLGTNTVNNVGTGLQTYSVQFPSPGNFKFECLVHTDMTGTVHVLNSSAPLPYDQNFYNEQALANGAALVSDASTLPNRLVFQDHDEDEGPSGKVIAGIGDIVTTTGAGSQTASRDRFLQNVVRVRVGTTVEWTNHDPSTPHTVTFGTEPADPRAPSANVTPTPDGARQATITSPNDAANSGLLLLGYQDRPMLAQAPLGVTRFRVTFTIPGTFNYICSLHDDLGMKGTVIVHQ